MMNLEREAGHEDEYNSGEKDEIIWRKNVE